MILLVLCEIWKGGGNVVLNGGDLDLIDHENLPQKIIDEAIKNVSEIESYLKSWENETKLNEMMRGAIFLMCGWQANEKLDKWLCNDEKALSLFDDWCIKLGKNLWTVYVDFRKYESSETNEIKMQLYEQAKAYMKRG